MVKLWIGRTGYFFEKKKKKEKGKSRPSYGESLILVIFQAAFRISMFLGQSIVKSYKQNSKICLRSGLGKTYP